MSFWPPPRLSRSKVPALMTHLDGDSDDNPAKMSEDKDDADAKLVDEVKNADTHNDTKHGCRLSLQHLIVFFTLRGSRILLPT